MGILREGMGMTKYFVNNSGAYIGGFDGTEPPAGSIEVPAPPASGTDVWDFETGQFISGTAPVLRYITKFAFRSRFSMGEKIAIELASIDDPTAPAEVRQQQATIRVMLKDVDASEFIDLDRADTRTGVQLLEGAGLLGAGRALEILDGPILPDERVT